MSFSIWISAFKDQKSFWFPVGELYDRFGQSSKSEDEGEFRLVINGETTSSMVVFERRANRIAGFAIERPPADPAFWRIIASFLRDLPCVLYWPSTSDGSCMGSLDLLPHLPDDFIEACGIPYVSTESEAIRKFVGKNS